MPPQPPADEAGEIVVYAPSLLVSVTIESGPTGGDELHVHAAGQGYWVARMLAVLGASPLLCCTLAGETGEVAEGRIDERVALRAVRTGGTTGAYVDDRRSGQRERVAQVHASPIDRHAIDDLNAVTVAEAVRAGVVVLTGTNLHGSVHPEVFERLSGNLHAVGAQVVADLAGAELQAVLRGHVDVLKVSHEELLDAGLAAAADPAALVEGAAAIRSRTGADVFVTCGGAGVLAVTSHGCWRVTSPTLTETDTRGAGDSFTAALAYGLRTGADLGVTLRLGGAAAAANVMRHGLGSGERTLIDAMARSIVLTRLD